MGSSGDAHARTRDTARRWLAKARAPAEDVAAAGACLASGQGTWLTAAQRDARNVAHANHASSSDPFYPLLPPSFITLKTERGTVLFNESRWWWGTCDEQHAASHLVGQRPELGWIWEPTVDDPGCVALRKGQSVLPSIDTLTHAFCKSHAGANILLVGDSMQGQLFSSFASIFAAQEPTTRRELHARQNSWSSCRIQKDYKLYPHEIDHSVTLCDNGPRGAAGGVSLRFIRNEWLMFDDADNERIRSPGRGTTSGQMRGAGLTMCSWEAAAADADIIVLNRGLHYAFDQKMREELNQTFSKLEALARRRTTSSRGPIRSILYRGTQAAIPNCSTLPDPLTSPWQAPAGYVSPYGWERLERHNRIARALIHRLPAPFGFLDTNYATSLRPGGRRGGTDCVHFCLPGPMDEWTRLMLALWT